MNYTNQNRDYIQTHCNDRRSTLTHICVLIISIHTYKNVRVFHQFYMIVEILFILHVTNDIHLIILVYLLELIKRFIFRSVLTITI